MPKLLFISSTGGHLSEMMNLKPMFLKYPYHIITEKDKSTLYLKDKYKGHINYLIYGTKDHKFSYPFKLLANCLKSLYFFIKIRPDFVISTGTHTAGPMICLAKIFRKKIIFIETFANVHTKTATGKLVYPMADLFLVQHKSMLKQYPKAIYKGWIY